MNGDLSFARGATYEVDLHHTLGSDSIHSTGRAAIGGGTVHSTLAQGVFLPGNRFTILTADGGRVGTFDALTQGMPFVDLALTYDATHVYLQSTRNGTGFCALALTANQCATAGGADSLGVGNPVHDAIASLSDPVTIGSALDLLSGELHASAQATLQEESSTVRDAVSNRLHSAFGEPAAAPILVMGYGPEGPVVAAPDIEGFAVWAKGSGRSAKASAMATQLRSTGQ